MWIRLYFIFSDLWQSHGKRMDAAVKLRSFEASYKQLVASLLSQDLKTYLQLSHFDLKGSDKVWFWSVEVIWGQLRSKWILKIFKKDTKRYFPQMNMVIQPLGLLSSLKCIINIILNRTRNVFKFKQSDWPESNLAVSDWIKIWKPN